MRLAPSVLSFDLTRMGESLPKLAALEPDVIHFDVMDGQFVPPITFGDAFVKACRPLVSTRFEVHLMTLTPERQFEAFAKAGCSRIIFHAEATVHAHRLVQSLHDLGVEAGVAINPGSPVELLEPIASDLDLALVMTVNPGWGGQKFIRETLAKVSRLRAAYPNLTIEVDGGVDPSTIGTAAAAGANLFVVGSFLANAKELSAAHAELEAGFK